MDFKKGPIPVKVKKLHPSAVIPKYAKSGDAGLDLVATSMERIYGGTPKVKFGTGLAFEIPEGYVGLIFPRSGIYKTPFRLSNSVGVVDSGYRGEVIVVLDKTPDEFCFNGDNSYDLGDRVAQMIILPYPNIELVESEDLSQTERGDGGFGSTGK